LDGGTALKITKQEVEHVAHLARLEFQEQEKEKFTHQLNNILTYMDKLNEIDTAGVEPMTHATFMVNAFRDDEVRPSLDPAAALSNAPDESGSCFRVPKVIE
jgi:aspartyl-tRNA(Asn)/glutamyl-tRNA(Gln) amidotransferase subunit C